MKSKNRLSNLFETDTLKKLFHGLDKQKQKKTVTLLRQMTKKMDELDMNDVEIDDDIKNLCQLNNLDLNMLHKEDINDFLNSIRIDEN